MRILKIDLHNINSIQSEHAISIDLQEQGFSDTGLFVITGSTGAGKTTILDAITIALYHKVPRFKLSHIKSGLEAVISHGAAEGMARVTFSCEEAIYEASWNMRLRRKNGTVLKNPTETVRLKNISSGEILAEKKSDVPRIIEEITQLNYDQFLRSMMLAQGEFAAFISAPNKEKGQLLEQLAGDDIYKKIGEEISSRLKKEEHALEEIAAKINTDDLLSEEDKALLTKENAEIDEAIATTKTNITTIKREIDWYDKQKDIARKKAVLAQDREGLNIALAEARPQLHLLKTLTEVEVFHHPLLTIEDKIKELATKENDIKNKEVALLELAAKLKQLEAKKADANTAHLAKEKDEKTWRPILVKAKEIDVICKGYSEQINGLNKNIKTATSELKTHMNLMAKTEDHKKDQNERIVKASTWIAANKHNEVYKLKITKWAQDFSHYVQQQNTIRDHNKMISELKIEQESQAKLFLENEKNLASKNTSFTQLSDKQKAFEAKGYTLVLAQQNTKLAISKDSLQDLSTALNIAKEHARLSGEVLDITKEIGDKKQRVINLTQAVKQQQPLLQVLETLVIDCEKLIESEQLIINLDNYRSQLQKDRPCALCGSTTHPFALEYKTPEIDESKKELAQRKTNLEELKLQLNELNTTIKVEEGKLSVSMSDLEKKQALLKEHIEKFAALKMTFKIDAILEIKTAIASQQNTTKDIEKKIIEINACIAEESKTKEALTLLQKELEPLKLQNIKLKTNTEKVKEDLLKLEKELAIASVKEQELKASILVQLKEANSELEFPSDCSLFIDDINKEIDRYERAIHKQNTIVNDIEKADVNLKTYAIQLDKMNRDLKDLQTQVDLLNKSVVDKRDERNKLIDSDLNINIKQAELEAAITTSHKQLKEATDAFTSTDKTLKAQHDVCKNIKEQVTKSKVELTDLQAEMTQNIEKSSFDGIEDIKLLLPQLKQKQTLLSLQKELDEKSIKLKTQQSDVDKEYEVLAKTPSPKLELHDLVQSLAKAEEVQEQSNQQKGKIKARFAMHDQLVLRNASVVDKIDAQKKVIHKWHTLHQLLGGSKDAFNIYVQRLTLKSLIDLANIHLQDLNPRYALRLDDSYQKGNELTFKIIDYFQANEMRNVETASGGEKFLISLSLALGLSDISSQNVKIESLFIDEGFGTLDNEMLETVIGTLENLKSQGKIIGIISHIEALKERIPTQIHVEKQGNGVSRVRVMA